MKRFALLGVILVGGLGFGLYQLTHSSGSPSSSQTSSSSSAGAARGTGATPSAPSAPALPSTNNTPTSAAGTSAAAPTTGTGTDPGTPASDPIVTKRPVEPHSTAPFKEHVPGREPPADTPEARQKDMNRRVERAACQAPGFRTRYNALGTEERAKLKARCLAAGVVIVDPK